MKLDKKTEVKIKKEALKFLKRGKPNWDVPHTLCAVKWMKLLIAHEGGDERTLIPAIYFHDTGYPTLQKNYNFDQLMSVKRSRANNHAKIAAKIVKEIFPKYHFTKKEINRIAYLVGNHNIHDNIIETDRQLVFEADGLAIIDVKAVKPNFDKKNYLRFLKEYYQERKKYMKTKTGKKYLKDLMKEVKKYLKNWQE